jgi:hypothetical protein
MRRCLVILRADRETPRPRRPLLLLLCGRASVPSLQEHAAGAPLLASPLRPEHYLPLPLNYSPEYHIAFLLSFSLSSPSSPVSFPFPVLMLLLTLLLTSAFLVS